MNILPYIVKKQNITNGVVITFIDITGRINDKLDIEKINADHETFIYSVSHDFRGPLTNMVLLLELLRSAFQFDNKADMLNLMDNMERSARSLKTMMYELTDLTKIGSDPNDQPEKVNIGHILEDVRFTLKNQIYQTHAKITTHIDVPELSFSRKNLRSILYNLISNAIKFTPSDKHQRF